MLQQHLKELHQLEQFWLAPGLLLCVPIGQRTVWPTADMGCIFSLLCSQTGSGRSSLLLSLCVTNKVAPPYGSFGLFLELAGIFCHLSKEKWICFVLKEREWKANLLYFLCCLHVKMHVKAFFPIPKYCGIDVANSIRSSLKRLNYSDNLITVIYNICWQIYKIYSRLHLSKTIFVFFLSLHIRTTINRTFRTLSLRLNC